MDEEGGDRAFSATGKLELRVCSTYKCGCRRFTQLILQNSDESNFSHRDTMYSMPSFPMPGSMNPDDVRYMHVDAIVQGKDRNRLKYLDLEGRWVLSGRSIPYISSVFNHIENLNYARGPLFDITEPALNAIGLVGWTAEKREEPKKEKKPFVIERPRVEVQEEVPQSPREVLPHRTFGYGSEHHVKRKISLASRDRSRSPSVSPSRGESPMPPAYDKYATKYKRKDSITSYGIKYGNDLGYASGASSGAPSPNYPQDNLGRPPHRTPSLSPLPGERTIHYDTAYDSSYLKKANERRVDELRIQTNRADLRSRGRYHSPGSQGRSDGSEQSSPNKSSRPVTAEEYLLHSYHVKTYMPDSGSRERRTRSEHRNY